MSDPRVIPLPALRHEQIRKGKCGVSKSSNTTTGRLLCMNLKLEPVSIASLRSDAAKLLELDAIEKEIHRRIKILNHNLVRLGPIRDKVNRRIEETMVKLAEGAEIC